MSREQSGGLSVTTLLIASASAAAAAVIVPLFWERGSIVATAITPIIVTLTSEALKKPVEKVSTVGVWRKTPQGTAVREPGGRDFEVYDPEEERLEVDPGQQEDPFGLREPERRSIFTRRAVIIALVTGLLAFGIAAIVVTAGELTFGGSTSGHHRTTFFGGRRTATPTPSATKAPKAKATATPDKNATPTPTPSTTPSATATPSASPSPTATPGVAPNAATPQPGAATPAPTP
jgi:hypothetical protein